MPRISIRFRASTLLSLAPKFARLDVTLGEGSFFAGSKFPLVDAVFGPVFRYFDVFDTIADFGIPGGLGKVVAWRKSLAARASIRAAVSPEYNELLTRFLLNRKSHLSTLP